MSIKNIKTGDAPDTTSNESELANETVNEPAKPHFIHFQTAKNDAGHQEASVVTVDVAMIATVFRRGGPNPDNLYFVGIKSVDPQSHALGVGTMFYVTEPVARGLQILLSNGEVMGGGFFPVATTLEQRLEARR
jgi:hypothetical protein